MAFMGAVRQIEGSFAPSSIGLFISGSDFGVVRVGVPG